ncbi:MAG: hypothetical protein K2L89_04060, partial [Muribaculaceae bacterium]|nr:hypothetical protein [Muribaculaceae bacterium]
LYVGTEEKVTISWAPGDAPFPGEVEWYIKEEAPEKEKYVWLEESGEANSIILQPCSPGVCTLVARVRVEELDRDRYEELETKLNLTYMPVEQLTFDPPEYTFEKTGGMYKLIKLNILPEDMPMDGFDMMITNPRVIGTDGFWGKSVQIISLEPGTSEVVITRDGEELGRMTVKVLQDEITEIKPESHYLEVYKGKTGEMRIIPDFPQVAKPGYLDWTVKKGAENIEMVVSEDAWSASFTGLQKGEATIEVNGGFRISTSFKVYVLEADVEKVVLDSDSYTVNMNRPLQIFPSTLPMDFEDTRFSYTLSNSNIAEIITDEEGSVYISPKALGETKMKVALEKNPLLYATATVKVIAEKPLTSLTIEGENHPTISMSEGESKELILDMAPVDATDAVFRWSTDASESHLIMTPSADTKSVNIEALRGGTYLVSATALDGSGLVATAKIVVNRVNPESISIENNDGEIRLGEENHTLKAKILPENASETLLTWSVGDSSVLSIEELSNDEVKIIPQSVGTAVVSVMMCEEPWLFDIVVIKVLEKESEIKIESLALDKEEVEIVEGWSDIVTALFPGENIHPELVWEIEDSSVADIAVYPLTNSVKVVGLTPGESMLTVSYAGLTARCKVKVLERPARVLTMLLDDDFITLGSEGAVASFDYDHEELGRPEVRWHSDDETVARIEDLGDGTVRIVPVGEGSCVIRVEDAEDSNSGDSRRITVGAVSSIDSIYGENKVYDLFDITGCVIRLGISSDELKGLAPGIYILRNGKERKRVIVK